MTVLWSACSLISQTDKNFRKRMSLKFGPHIFFGNDKTSDMQEYANMKSYNAILEFWVLNHSVVFAKSGGKNRSAGRKKGDDDEEEDEGPPPAPPVRRTKKPVKIPPAVPRNAPKKTSPLLSKPSSSRMRHMERMLSRKKAQLEKETNEMNFEKCVELQDQIDELQRDFEKLKKREQRKMISPSDRSIPKMTKKNKQSP